MREQELYSEADCERTIVFDTKQWSLTQDNRV